MIYKTYLTYFNLFVRNDLSHIFHLLSLIVTQTKLIKFQCGNGFLCSMDWRYPNISYTTGTVPLADRREPSLCSWNCAKTSYGEIILLVHLINNKKVKDHLQNYNETGKMKTTLWIFNNYLFILCCVLNTFKLFKRH